jgi:DNA-binding NtrC family response regulator
MRRDGTKILVVDPDDGTAADLADALAELGLKVVTAPHVHAARAMVRDDPSIAVLLIDILLPGAQETTDYVRLEHQGVHVVFMTGYSEMLLLDREVPGRGPLLRKPLDSQKVRKLFVNIN